MNAWQTVLLIVVILLVVALIGWALSRRQLTARRETQARGHLNEARERQARAESTRAAAAEKAAQLRRERAELEQRAAQQEREAAQLAADADRDQARAAELQERARKLAPQLADEPTTVARDTTPVDGDAAADTAGYADTRGFDAHPDREPATAYRHTAPVTDPDATTEDVAEDVAEGDPTDGDRPSLRERLTGHADSRVDDRDVAVEDQDVTDATRRRQ